MKKIFKFLINKNLRIIVFCFLSLFIISICLIFSNNIKNYNDSAKANIESQNISAKINYDEIEKKLEKNDEDSTINFINSSKEKLSNLINTSSIEKNLGGSNIVDNNFYSKFLNEQRNFLNFFKEKNYSFEQIQKFNKENLIDKYDFSKKMEINSKINLAISYLKKNEKDNLNNFASKLNNNFKVIFSSRNIYKERKLVKILKISKNSIDIAAGLLSVTSAALWAAAPWTFGATVFAAVLATSVSAVLWAASTTIQNFIIIHDPDIPNSKKIEASERATIISSLSNILGSAISYFGALIGFKTTFDSIVNLFNELQ